MIKYRLVCKAAHEFEGWFQSSHTFEEQAAAGQIGCPVCGVDEVERAIMAPSLARRRDAAPSGKGQATLPDAPNLEQMRSALLKFGEAVRSTSEYVGPRFAEEARKIHFAESPARGIYGEASLDEVKSLAEDGIPCLPLPRLPDDMN